MSCTVTIEEFKTMFDRGPWTYTEELPDVRDKDLTEALEEAEAVFNNDLLSDVPEVCKKAKMYLMAHFLTLDLEMAESEGAVKLLQSSRSADGVSESLAVPPWMLEGDYAQYTTTAYGIKFITLIKPYLDGAVYSVPGRTSF